MSMVGFLGLAAFQVFTYSVVNNEIYNVKERLKKVEAATNTNTASAASASTSISSLGTQIAALNGRKKRSVDAEESFDNEREGRNLVSEAVKHYIQKLC